MSNVPLPMVWSCLIPLASWMVPRRERSEWRARWDSAVRNWWTLVERGEVAGEISGQLAAHCRAALADAFWTRFSKDNLRRWVRGPRFVVVCTSATLLLLAILTHAFAVTRRLIEIARDLRYASPEMAGAREGALVAYGFPILFALATGIVLVAFGRLPLRTYGWRYWSFLLFKTASVMVILPLLWIEGGAALRAHISNLQLRVFGGGLALALIFVAAFGCALLWAFADQRRRCPVCLERLAMPVTIGSWGSVFDPVATELLCNEGHGSLYAAETRTGEADCWTAFGASWRSLFAAHESKKDDVSR
jgi:hypothetical protein